MSKKIILLLILSTILLAGCKSSDNPSNKTPTAKDSVTISPKATTTASSTDGEKAKTTNIIVEGKDTNSSAKLPPLTSAEKAKVTDNINSVVTSIDSVLNSQDDVKELDLN